MKLILTIIGGLLGFFGIFYIDKLLINLLLDLIPKSSADWIPLIKLVLWFLAIVWTTYLAIIVGSIFATLTAFLVFKK